MEASEVNKTGKADEAREASEAAPEVSKVREASSVIGSSNLKAESENSPSHDPPRRAIYFSELAAECSQGRCIHTRIHD
jgi:hypothetical protein